MAVLKCKMCGGNLEVTEDMTVCECEYCGTKQTVPTADNDKKLGLFSRANMLRFNNEFDKASALFENIIAEFPAESEAYWGLVLCKFGIEYVDDPATGKKIPTCHRTVLESVFDDPDFQKAMDCADPVAVRIYRSEAKEIDRIQQSILNIVKNEKPYDIFICYKETAEDGQRTKDSVMAQDIYDALTAKGYKVFFARITLEDKLGQEYEPYIFAALSSAKIMLSIGTSYDNFNAVWVKNEWSRFLAMMKTDKSKVLIPCYCDCDAYDMPQEFRNLQGQDMGKVGFIQDLVRGIGKIIPAPNEAAQNTAPIQPQTVVQQVISSNAENLLKRGFMSLEESEWDEADRFFERVLDENVECAEAYLGKLLIKNQCSSIDDLYSRLEDILIDLSFQHYVINDDTLAKKVIKYGGQESKDIINKLAGKEKEIWDHYTGLEKKLCLPAVSVDGTAIEIPTFLSEKEIKGRSVYAMAKVSGNDSVVLSHISLADKISELLVPDGFASIAANAFSDCKSLAKITISDSVSEIGSAAFSGCSSLSGVTLPDGLTKLNDDTFNNCTLLSSVEMSSEITEIGKRAFRACFSLNRIQLPAKLTMIDENAFYHCKSLDGVSFPDSLTSIGQNAFAECNSLKSIKLPASVSTVGKNAFAPCEITVDDENQVSLLMNSGVAKKFIVTPSTIEAERERQRLLARERFISAQKQAQQRQQMEYRSKGLCQYCGGSFGGFFARVCTSCGKKKDYKTEKD